MPSKASKYCYKCSRIAVSGGLCEVHRKEADKQVADSRNNKWLWMYKTPEWKAMRRVQLENEPLCCECLKENRLTKATTVHHRVAHKGLPKLFYNADLLQSLCASCHSRITSKEDGGFNNPIK